MDKYHDIEMTGADNTYRYNYNGTTFRGKIMGYIGFARYARTILRNGKYDFIIVWGELTAVLNYRTLIAYYDEKYCVNIRDLFVKKRKILNYLLFRAIRKAEYVSVPSEKYIEKLPSNYDKYVFFHSYNDSFMKETVRKSFDHNKRKIHILFIGNIRFYDHVFSFINMIKNDERYEFTVAGTGANPIAEYVHRNSIHNIKIIGKFPKEDTPYFLGQADVIYNVYGTNDENLRIALSNKLYYALFLHLPILVCKDTFMDEISSSCGIGYAVDMKEPKNFADNFYEWFFQLDRDDIRERCDKMIEFAKASQDLLLKTFVGSIRNN
ncbi:MAG: hypothetical protein ABFC94_14650 [Syntrophomonas sp.]